MTNITALLLVLTLTGAPVASVVCATECQRHPATSGDCHGDMATNDGPMMSAGESCSDPSIAETPYVVEHRAVADAAVPATASFPMMLQVVRTDAPAIVVTASIAPLEPPLVLRI